MAHGAEPGAAQRCAGRRWDGRWHHPCPSKGKVEEDGKQWCRVHAPSIVEARRKASNAKWQAKWDSQRTHQAEAKAKQAEQARRAACYPVLLDALKGVMKLIDDGVLVRDISGDSESDWAAKQIPLVKALKDAQAAIEVAEN